MQTAMNGMLARTANTTARMGGPALANRVATQPWKPRWLHAGAGAPREDLAIRSWEELARTDVAASIYFSPAVALAPRQNRETPVVYARWTNNTGAARLNSLAVLPADRLKIALISRLGWNLTTPTWRVLENGLIGDNSTESLRCFVSSIADLLDSGPTNSILFQDLDVTSPLRGMLATVARERDLALCYPRSLASRWWIRFPDAPSQYWSQFSKKTRYNFRYRAKRLEHTVRVVTRPEEIPTFLDAVRSVEQRTWQYRRLGLASDVQQKLELWREIAALGAFRSYLLEHKGCPLAFVIGAQWHDRYVYVETGYDPHYAAKSPGQVLLYRVLDDLIAHNPPKSLDFGFGDSEYKRVFANHETKSGPVVLARRSFRAMAPWRLMQYRSSTARTLRRMLAAIGMLSPLRHLQRGTFAALVSDATWLGTLIVAALQPQLP